MPKSKNSSKKKNHKERLAKYKANKKKDQELFKKKMIDNYIKMQQEAVANKESHTSTEEVVGPDINIDDLNNIEDWEPEIVTGLNASEVTENAPEVTENTPEIVWEEITEPNETENK